MSIIRSYYTKIINAYARFTLPKFANKPCGCRVAFPRQFINAHRITMGNDVSIGPGSVFEAIESFLSPKGMQHFAPKINIGNRVGATGLLHIHAVESITIGDDVLFASNVFIADAFHGHSNVEVPFKDQALTKMSSITIGRGCWIGQNVVICPGVSIGDFCIVGANSVVTHDMPNRTMAAGTPARIIKDWDDEQQAWVKHIHADQQHID